MVFYVKSEFLSIQAMSRRLLKNPLPNSRSFSDRVGWVVCFSLFLHKFAQSPFSKESTSPFHSKNRNCISLQILPFPDTPGPPEASPEELVFESGPASEPPGFIAVFWQEMQTKQVSKRRQEISSGL